MLKYVAIAVLCIGLLPNNAFGGRFFAFNNSVNCFSQPIHQAFVQPLVTFPTVNYFVGAPIRLQSLIQQELQVDPLYQEFQQFKAFKQLQLTQPQLQTQTQLQASLPQQIQPLSLIEQNCAKCHTGATPKSNFSIDGLFGPIERDKAARMVILGKMPKGATLSPADKGDLIKEILLLGVEE